MTHNSDIQEFLAAAIQLILTKISLDYNLSITELSNKIKIPILTENLEDSIKQYRDILLPVEKLVSEPVSEGVITKPKKIIKKKPVTTATEPLVATLAEVQVVTEETKTETVVATPEKPKKIIKKKPIAAAVEPLVATVPEVPVVTEEAVAATSDKPKKIIKKKTETAPIVVPVPEKIIDVQEEELKLKSKKNILKKQLVQSDIAKVFSQKNQEQAEYGEEVDNTEIYETLQTYEDDSVEPIEINGTKYYVDTSGYIYDFDNQDLIGKLNHNKDSVILLSDFTSSQD